jgi:hypothetical protein
MWHVALLLFVLSTVLLVASSNLRGSIWRDEDDRAEDDPGLEGLRLIMYPMAGIDSAIDRLQEHGTKALLGMRGAVGTAKAVSRGPLPRCALGSCANWVVIDSGSVMPSPSPGRESPQPECRHEPGVKCADIVGFIAFLGVSQEGEIKKKRHKSLWGKVYVEAAFQKRIEREKI